MSVGTTTESAASALERLRRGNLRFLDRLEGGAPRIKSVRPVELVDEQRPFAIVLGCSDSRVPAEIVFDQGLGSLFVIRVAGNIVAPSQIGSVEFAAERFGTRLVVVMGHTGCGAVDATLDSILNSAAPGSNNLKSIVDRIRPALEPLCHTELSRDRPALMRAGVRANVLAAANQLRHGSGLLESLITNSGLCVIGAEYDLATGIVDFFDGCP
jgi:carbonic anhydrase